MEERARRIVDTAIELAEKGGYEAVRLRDVAAHAGVALGTVYKRFRSKEDILVAAIEREWEKVDMAARALPMIGETPSERVIGFFTLLTRALYARPHLTRAIIRALTSGEPELADRVIRFHGRISALVSRAIAGDDSIDDIDERLPLLLEQTWFAALVGWMGNVHTQQGVLEQMRYATEKILG